MLHTRDPHGTIRLLTKGAESSILPKCTNRIQGNRDVKNVTADHINDYAANGLRTLAVAIKTLTEQEYSGSYLLNSISIYSTSSSGTVGGTSSGSQECQVNHPISLLLMNGN